MIIMRKNKKSPCDIDKDIAVNLGELLCDRHVLEMKRYIQHGKVSTYDHCMTVTEKSVRLCLSLHLPVNYKTLIIGAFLHDFYLYDWHITKHKGSLHGYTHPVAACNNAKNLLGQSPEVVKIIRTHMWPLTLMHFPTSCESWVVCIVDKYVSFCETLSGR